MPTSVQESTPRPLIAGFSIDRLYGKYSYECNVDLSDNPRSPGSRLLILYGDNGSGKTTVLKLLWNLLSPDTTQHHRDFIAETAFQAFTVRLTTGHEIVVSRPKGKYLGAFTIEVKKANGKSDFVCEYPTDENLKIIRTAKQALDAIDRRNELVHSGRHDLVDPIEWMSAAGDKYIAFLENILMLNPYFLMEDRTIHSDMFIPARTGSSRYRERSVREGSADAEIDSAMVRATQAIRAMAFKATNSGTETANSVYLEVLASLTTAKHGLPVDIDIETLIEALEAVTASFSRFELMPKLEGKKYLALLRKMPKGQREVAERILMPYLSGVNSRMAALDQVHTLLQHFTNRANNYLNDKTLMFTMQRGLRVAVPEENTILAGASLSSGERQLMLLLCNTIVARDAARVFLIDEPEISLNVKWQRTLLDTLLELTEGTGLQFVVATHSIELLSPYRRNVASLKNTWAKDA